MRESDVDHQIAALARDQDRLVTTAQLRAIGLRQSAIDERGEAGRLFRVVRGVHLVGAPVLDWPALRRTGLLCAGAGSVVHDLSAAQGWNLLPLNPTLVTIGRTGQSKFLRTDLPTESGRRGVIQIRQCTFRPDEISSIEGVEITSVPRTLIDIAGNHRRLFDRAWREAQYRNLIDWEATRRAAESTRRPGSPLVAARVDDHLGADLGLPASPAEYEFVQMLLRAGVPEPLVNHGHLVGGRERRSDLFFPFAGHIVEIDGWQGHRSREAFEDDALRDSDFLEAGITTQRFTARRAMREPERCAHLVLTQLERRREMLRLGL